jgi:hypothetical protein
VQDEIQVELAQLLRREGVFLRGFFLGHVDLPERYRVGLEGLLAEELATQKMKYTLELKEKKLSRSTWRRRRATAAWPGPPSRPRP